MTDSPAAADPPAAPRRGRGPRWPTLLVVAPVLLGALAGLAWWALAPTARVVRLDASTLYAPTDPELQAAQDGVLALLLVGAGLLGGLVAAGASARAPLLRSTLAVLGAGVGGVLAVAVGRALGPHAAGVSPLTAHSPALLVVQPFVTALVLALVLAVSGWRRSGHPG